MDRMMEGLPFWGAWLALFVVGMARGQATYALGRLAARGAGRTRLRAGWWLRFQDWLASDRTTSGRTIVQRLGLVAVPLAYLTVGLQTAVLVTAGVVRIPWGRFTLAQVPGVVVWASLYSTVGLAGWRLALAAVSGTGVLPALGVLVVVVAAVVLVRRAARRAMARAASPGAGEGPGAEDRPFRSRTTAPPLD